MTHTYDINQSYQFNYERGPTFSTPVPKIRPGPSKSFLGFEVRSRIGMSAGLLLNSKWVLGYAERGFDILTYKTVRSSYRPCYDPPNWVFVDDNGQIEGPVYIADRLPEEPSQLSSAVCFGMPSMAPEVWRADVRRAKAGLARGQMLIVSVVATPGEEAKAEEVSTDFCQCALWAAEAGADAIEANFSCPNVCSQEGTIYMDVGLSCAITIAMRATLGKTPLLIKVGDFRERSLLRKFLQ